MGSSAVGKLMSGVYTAEVTPISFVVMVGTLAVNLGVTTYERRCAKRLKSEVLAADANHTLSDALVSIGVIIGLAAVALGFPVADPVMALVVTVAILATAYDVFKHALATLSDRARIPEEDLHAVAVSVPGVQDAHHIRTRGTEGEVYADLHVLVAPEMTVGEAHELSERVEAAIEQRFPNVIEVLVHIEPNDGHED
nr:cation diffusion facilitator family transporter [Eggerthella sinensis]